MSVDHATVRIGDRARVRSGLIMGRVLRIFAGPPVVALIERQDSGHMRYAELADNLEPIK